VGWFSRILDRFEVDGYETFAEPVQDVSQPWVSPEMLSAFGISYFGSEALTRDAALAVPSVMRSVNIICGSISQLPLHFMNQDADRIDYKIGGMPESGIARSVTISKTIDDLMFWAVSYWRITDRDKDGYPSAVKHHSPTEVTTNTNGTYTIGQKTYQQNDVIQFVSGNKPLLKYGRAIRAAADLEVIAALLAQEGILRGYFRPTEGADVDEVAIAEGINTFIMARKNRSIGYVPSALEFVETNPNAVDLGLEQARQHAALEVGRLTGISPNRLGISVQSMTYSNVESENLNLYRETLMPFIKAIEERLSMGDVSKRGHYAKFSLAGFLRPDTKTRYESYKLAIEAGFMTIDEARAFEDWKPL